MADAIASSSSSSSSSKDMPSSSPATPNPALGAVAATTLSAHRHVTQKRCACGRFVASDANVCARCTHLSATSGNNAQDLNTASAATHVVKLPILITARDYQAIENNHNVLRDLSNGRIHNIYVRETQEEPDVAEIRIP